MLELVFLLFIIYLISRVAHYFYNCKKKLDDIDEKLGDIRDQLSKRN
ncbi:hypothetical protein [Metabacillus litoralis]|nr:hypothetical protein [Metabacillus litoralis]